MSPECLEVDYLGELSTRRHRVGHSVSSFDDSSRSHIAFPCWVQDLARPAAVTTVHRHIRLPKCQCPTAAVEPQAPATAPTVFFFLALVFLLLRSRGFKVVMPALQASA